VSAAESADVLVCDHCGRSCAAVEEGRDWLHLEVTREQSVDGLHWWEVDFCSQEHAAAWLQAPLPEPIQGNGMTSPTTWTDLVALDVLVGILGLFGLGVRTAIRLVISLF
jgi:hypothetical protein